MTHVTVLGHSYTVPEDGRLEPVSADHVRTLTMFGFRPIDESADALDALPQGGLAEAREHIHSLLDLVPDETDAKVVAAREFLSKS